MLKFPISIVMKQTALFLLFVFVSLMTYSQDMQLKSFDELMSALNSGKHVRVIMHYSKCKLIINKEEQAASPDAILGMNIDTYEYFAAGIMANKNAFLVFSDSKLIKNPIGSGYVYNYGKVKISADNSVQILAQYLNPKNYNVLMDEMFIGEINNRDNDGGIFLFQ